MRKIILLLTMCVLCLCGCSTSNISTDEKEAIDNTLAVSETNTQELISTEEQTSIVGIWHHTEYPNAYTINIKSLEGRNMSLVMEAVRGNYSQIATAEVDDAYFMNNKTKFSFEDSFGNIGTCEIKIIGDEMHVSYDVKSYQGNWCVDAGEGTYKRSENFNNSTANSGAENSNINHTSNSIPASIYFDSGKYAKVIGYGYKGDVYDKDVYYHFDWPNENEFIYSNYSDNSYGRDEFGEYKVLSSDKPGYNFKLVFDYADGHNEAFYVKTIIERTVFDFYLSDGTPYSRFENYDNYAVKRTSEDGKTYHFRYDYEYKEYQKGTRSSSLESPFKEID